MLLPAALLLLPAPAQAAAAASKRSGLVSQQDERNLMSSWQLDAFVDRMWDLSGPILNNMGFSGLLGACTAAALKWVGRTLAASVGIGLVLVQVLSYYNIIIVNWSIVHKQARQVLDSTGDGRLDQDDFKRVVKQGLVVLSEGVPSLSGFLVGFLVGMKVF